MTTSATIPITIPTRYRFTVTEYYAMGDAGIFTEDDPVELLDGDIIVLPPVQPWHSASVSRLTHNFVPSLQRRAVVSVQGPTRLNDESEPQPDIMLLRWRDDYYEGGHPRPADVLLLIEVSDTTLDYDRNTKLSAYARAGIPEVWIVSRQDRRIEAYTSPSEGTYSNVRRAGPNDTIAPQAFPDITLDVGPFFPHPKPQKTETS